jgi:hypothetical protein
MCVLFEFEINPVGELTRMVLELGMTSFNTLASYVQSLQYGRRVNKYSTFSVLEEGCGTCSSKHQLLATIAHENGHTELLLRVGIYKMCPQNTPGVGVILDACAIS